jgi:predicted RNA-binding Zn ribbon-like protein
MAGRPPLAVTFANTRRRRGAASQELLRSGADLEAWARHEAGRVPPVGAETAQERLDEIRVLRDDVIALLTATVAGEPPPRPTERVNSALRAVPLVPQLDPDGHARLLPAGPAEPLDELLAHVAASAVELAGAGAESPLALCDAPSCGQFFMRHRRGQRWCSPACGTRARVARHAAHQREVS